MAIPLFSGKYFYVWLWEVRNCMHSFLCRKIVKHSGACPFTEAFTHIRFHLDVPAVDLPWANMWLWGQVHIASRKQITDSKLIVFMTEDIWEFKDLKCTYLYYLLGACSQERQKGWNLTKHLCPSYRIKSVVNVDTNSTYRVWCCTLSAVIFVFIIF